MKPLCFETGLYLHAPLELQHFFRRIAFILLMIAVPCSNVSAKGVEDVLSKIKATVALWEIVDYTVANIDIDQLSKNSDTRSLTRKLYSGNKYQIIAIGDRNFTDVDLTVYKKVNGSWVNVGKDVDTSNVAIVELDCSYSTEYKFEVKAYSFAAGSGTGYYGLAILFK